MQEEYCKLLNVSRNTYYVHKREDRPIISLLEKYFTEDDLKEFLETGRISRFESTTNYTNQIDLLKNLNTDNAIFSAKEKYQKYLFGDIFDQANNYGAREILKDILKTIEYNEIFMDTAKDFLIERVKGYEAKWLSLKNPQKVKLLSSILKSRFSKIEVYAICKYSDEILET